MRIRWESHRADTVIVDLSAEFNPRAKLFRRLVRLVDVLGHLALHKASRMINRGINNTVLDCLGDNVLGVLFRIKMQLHTHVAERNARVGEGDGSERSLDDEMAQTEDEKVGRVGLKDLFIRRKRLLERSDVSTSDGLDDLKVRGKRVFENGFAECCAIGNDTGEENDNDVVFVNLCVRGALGVGMDLPIGQNQAQSPLSVHVG